MTTPRFLPPSTGYREDEPPLSLVQVLWGTVGAIGAVVALELFFLL